MLLILRTALYILHSSESLNSSMARFPATRFNFKIVNLISYIMTFNIKNKFSWLFLTYSFIIMIYSLTSFIVHSKSKIRAYSETELWFHQIWSLTLYIMYVLERIYNIWYTLLFFERDISNHLITILFQKEHLHYNTLHLDTTYCTKWLPSMTEIRSRRRYSVYRELHRSVYIRHNRPDLHTDGDPTVDLCLSVKIYR